MDQINFSYCFNRDIELAIFVTFSAFLGMFLLLYYYVFPKYIIPHCQHIQFESLNYLDVISRINSLIHGILVVILMLICENMLIVQLNENIIYSKTKNIHKYIASIVIGYFLYDLIFCCIIYSIKISGKPDYVYIIHHIIAGSAFFICIILTNYGGYVALLSLFYHEINVTLLLFPVVSRNIFNHSPNKMLYIMCEILHVLTYAILRFGFCGYILYQVWFEFTETNILFKIYPAIQTMANLGYFPVMVLAIYRKLKINTSKALSRAQYNTVPQIASSDDISDKS